MSPWCVVPVLVAVAAALRLVAFVGICRLDMFRYIEVSRHVLLGGSLFDPQVFFASARLPLIMPLIASNALAGYGEHVSVAWPLICSVGAVVMAYLLGRELFGDSAGVLAGLLMAFFPLEVELGTQLLPDAIESFFVLTAVYLAVLALRRDTKWQLWALSSGASLVVAYHTRVNAAVFLIGLLAAVFLEPARWKRAAWIVAGVGLALILFAAAFWALSGDPIVDIHKAQSIYGTYKAGGFIERQASFREMILSEPSLNLLVPLGFIGILGFANVGRGDRNRSAAMWLLLAWAIGFYIYLEFISPLHGLDSSYRYAEPMVPPVLLLCAAAIAGRAARRGAAVRLLAAVLGMALLFSMVNTGRIAAARFRGSPRWVAQRQAASFAKAHPGAAIFVTKNDQLVALNYYSGFSLGRDTLEPVDREVNRKARLFIVPEQPVTNFDERYLVVESLQASPTATPVETYPFVGDRLGVYRLK